MSADRLPPLPPAAWSDEQRREAQPIIDGPRGALVSPFVPLLRSPELMGHAQRMGEYLRYRSAVGTRLSELAILITAQHWSQPVEWAIHAPIAEFPDCPSTYFHVPIEDSSREGVVRLAFEKVALPPNVYKPVRYDALVDASFVRAAMKELH